jgi:hypothetical protein
MLVGMEFVTREIHFYTIFEVAYSKKHSGASELLADELVKTYTRLLSFLVTAKKFYMEHSWSNNSSILAKSYANHQKRVQSKPHSTMVELPT